MRTAPASGRAASSGPPASRPADCAACTSPGSTPRARAWLKTARKTASCSSEGARSSSSARAKCVNTPSSWSAGSRATASIRAAACSGATPIRRIPVSISTCTAQRLPLARAASRAAARSPGWWITGVRASASACSACAGTPPSTRIGTPTPASRSAAASEKIRHREPPAAGGDQRAGDGNRAVAIGVRLHHRDHLARARQLARQREVRADRLQMDGRPDRRAAFTLPASGLAVRRRHSRRLRLRSPAARCALRSARLRKGNPGGAASAVFDHPRALG